MLDCFHRHAATPAAMAGIGMMTTKTSVGLATRVRAGRHAPQATPKTGRADTYWRAVAARDPAFDGTFCYSVATTGVYCRPSCAARRPKRENVAFHDSWRTAEAAGYRACKRCKPSGPGRQEAESALIAASCRQIEDAEEPPTLAALSAAAGLSPFHFHRVFKSVTGVTPKAYATAHRRERVREALAGTQSVTKAIHEAGFNSSGRFYAAAPADLGMAPSAFRAGGRNVDLRVATARCTLGVVLVAASVKGVAAILLGDDPGALARDLEALFPRANLVTGDDAFKSLVARVVSLVEAPETRHSLPLDICGTAFQQRVWAALRKIPAGTTATYADIASRIGAPTAVRAVAGACAANPIAVAVPCHRVVRRDGALAGYRWGPERKEWLLAREAKSKLKR
jgi:AraC family transcriptional regulator of adaptative response/methylated-DNA-[protein]-cysteine methyltransferase